MRKALIVATKAACLLALGRRSGRARVALIGETNRSLAPGIGA